MEANSATTREQSEAPDLDPSSQQTPSDPKTHLAPTATTDAISAKLGKGRQKSGVSAGYIRELENKVNRIEAMLLGLSSQVENHISTSPPGSGWPNILEPIDSQQRLPHSPGRRAVAPRYKQRTPPYHTPELNISTPVIEAPEAVSNTDESDLPPVELLYTLVDLYFKHINTWCPILDRRTTFEQFFGFSGLHGVGSIVLYAIVAIALRFSQDPSLTPDIRRRYRSVAKTKVLLHAVENPSIESLQALVILAWDFLGSSDGLQNGNIIALVTRTTLQLNLQVESTYVLSSPTLALTSPSRFRDSILPKPGSWIEEEGRRRLFWMAYILERYAGIATGSDFVLREPIIERFLPCRYDLFSENRPVETRWSGRARRAADMTIDHPENLGSFSYHCEVVRTLSRVQDFLQTPVDIYSLAEVEQWERTYEELDNELNTWLKSVPDEYSNVSQFCHSDPTSKISNWIILHAAFVISVVRLHSCAAYPPVQSHIFIPSLHALQRCRAAVQSLREIAQDVFDTGMLNLLGPQFAFSLYVAARLLLVHTGSKGEDLDSSYQFFVFILEQMAQQWSLAGHYVTILSAVSHRTQTRWSSGSCVVPKGLARMRRIAYEIYLSTTRLTSSSILPIKSLSVEDLECLELFDFFNYPRLPPAMTVTPSMYAPLFNRGDLLVS
ncbi:fungal specific transcription factor domain-containing protein [Aspergillus tanneri]|uniref:Xylanolytic transcriptional activator regulatory domain-containing protein n=1 Tax=Aspergillus tanneri TaxID=1220188 RepID=A0A5M9MZ87_9EURO|nr:uncharacterized protein ATNIH1004_001336 [Aspergillus tanneri]KAA8652432.1 hypothetical protein ATNIH1004_001336 [Aspergillus tanneri]